MKQGASFDALNEPAVAAGTATAKTSSAAICVRVMGPSWAARTKAPLPQDKAERLPVY